MSMGWYFWFKTHLCWYAEKWLVCWPLCSVVLCNLTVMNYYLWEALVHSFGSVSKMSLYLPNWHDLYFFFHSVYITLCSSTMLTWEILEVFFFNYSSLSGFDSTRCSILRLGSSLHSHFISDLIIHKCLILLSDIFLNLLIRFNSLIW